MEAILGLAALIVLGYLTSYHFRKFFHRWKGFDEFITSGFLFIFFGILVGPKFLNILSFAVIRQLDPFIYLALGWIGFIVGIQFEGRLLRHVSRKLFTLSQLESVISSIVLFLIIFFFLSGTSVFFKISTVDIWTSAIILTVCGAISSSLTIHYYARTLPEAKKTLHPLEFIVSLHVFVRRKSIFHRFHR